MSYILDALKKAEAERQQGTVPNLYAQPSVVDFGHAGRRHRRLGMLVGGTAILTAIFLLAWLKPWRATSGASPEPALKISPAMQAPKPADEHASSPAAATIVAIAPAPQSKPEAVEKKPDDKIKSAAQRRKPNPATPAREASPDTHAAAVPPAVSPPPATPPAADTDRYAALPHDVPAQLRAEVPAVTIGGYIYSDIPADRQLLVNKRLLHEGDEVAPGLRLEKMLPKAVVFNYKGYRYQVAY